MSAHSNPTGRARSASGRALVERDVTVEQSRFDMSDMGKHLGTGEPPSAPPTGSTSSRSPVSGTSSDPHGRAPAKRGQPQVVQRLEALVSQQIGVAESHREFMSTCRQQMDAVAQERQDLALAYQQQVESLRQRMAADAQDSERTMAQLRAERDALKNEVSEIRSKAADDVRKVTQQVTASLRQLEEERAQWRAALQEAHQERDRVQDKLDKTTEQLTASMNARDRVEAQIATLENRFEQVAVPLRKELDRLRAERQDLVQQLSEARTKIEALQLLSRRPS